jgi:streptogramin lyase
MLDPRTGIVKEYTVPPTPGVLSGTHRVAVDKNDIVWFSENWSHNLTRLDPRTGRFTQMPIEVESPMNSAGFSNFGLAPNGDIWETNAGHVIRIRPENGVAKIINQYKMGKEPSTYDNMVTEDGNFWVGGGPASGGTTKKLLDIRTGQMETLELPRHMAAARGGVDPNGDAWFGGRGGSIVQLDTSERRIREYWPPVATAEFYEAMPDAKGEVWAGELHGSGFLRLNPKTDQWTQYQMPEPYAHDRRTWIDNSTDPISVWYIDYQGYIVRIQPLD